MSNSVRKQGFTVVELLIALTIMVVVGGVGSQIDLVDLLDNEKYLSEQGIDSDTASLIGKLEVQPKEGEEFRIQVLCSELGKRGSIDALPRLQELAAHEDYFLSKRAKVAIDQIKSFEKKQKPNSHEKIKAMLPEDAKLAFDSGDNFKGNIENSKNLYQPAIQNETLMMIQNKIGNAQVDSLQIVTLNEERTSFLVLATGHFYQAKLSETLKQLSFKESLLQEQAWVGSMDNRENKIQLALHDSRSLVAEISVGEPFVLNPSKLVDVARALNKE